MSIQRLGDYTREIQSRQSVRPLIASLAAMAKAHGAGDYLNHVSDPATREVLKRRAFVARGAVTPSNGIAALQQTNVLASLVSVLGPFCAFSGLASAAIPVAFDHNAGVLVPTAIVGPDNGAVFMEAGATMRVGQFAFTGPVLGRKKMGFAVGLTNEIARGENAETWIQTLLAEQGALAAEKLILDATEGDDIRPQGIRYGVNALAATAGGTVEAMKTDISNLASAVAMLAGNMQNIVFVGTPDLVVKILLSTPNFPFKLLASHGLGVENTLLALAANCFCMASDGEIRFTTSNEASLHFEDADPQAFSTADTPNVVAAPLRNLFQTDCCAIRLTTDLNWCLRNATGTSVAWVENVTWGTP